MHPVISAMSGDLPAQQTMSVKLSNTFDFQSQ
jgi:hypothetical protein